MSLSVVAQVIIGAAMYGFHLLNGPVNKREQVRQAALQAIDKAADIALFRPFLSSSLHTRSLTC